MNFLKSVLFDDEETDEKEVEKLPLKDVPDDSTVVQESSPPSRPGSMDWGLGTMLKNIASKSEEVFKDYQKEFQEFGIGLQKETEEIVGATSHHVKDLPSHLEAGAHVAQVSFEEVGHTLEDFGTTLWKGTEEIFAQVKEAVAMVEEEAANAKVKAGSAPSFNASLQRGKYSRYEAQISAMQRDSSTYCDEPEDKEEFAKWREEFKLADKKADIDNVLKDNAFMQELQSRIVPTIVEHETFWIRYFYRLHKLQQAEDARADLVKRAATTEEEELTWDVDEDGEDSLTPSKALNKEQLELTDDVKEPDVLEKEGVEEEILGHKAATSPAGEDQEIVVKSAEVVPVTSVAATPVSSKQAGPENDEEDNTSEGSSAASEWQVVQKEESGKAPADAKVVTALNSQEVTEAKNVPAGSPQEKVVTSERKDKAGASDESEDWSEWE